jgi:probable F420-dependent oxidoreductase
VQLGKVGVWWSGSWKAPDGAGNVAGELEALGYGALWSSGGFDAGLAPHFERLLESTQHVVVASGIVNIWTSTAEAVATAVARLDELFGDRFLLGLGASHAPLVENYSHPYRHMVEYLDALDTVAAPVMRERRVLAALGPRMVELAASRSVGAHPYLVPVEHTRRAREILGAGPLLAPEVTVVVDSDEERGREQARRFVSGYLTLPNYANNLRSLGFSEADVSGGGSDRLVDAVVAHGDVDAVAARIKEHHDAGADHVAVQVLADMGEFPIDAYRALAPAVITA